MFRQVSGVHSISIRGVASGSLCSAGITMAKLKRSRRYDLACDMNWSFTYFIGRSLSRGPEDALSNPEGGTYMAERCLQLYILWD